MIDWPDTLIPSEMSLGVSANTKTFTSSFTNADQTRSDPGAKVMCTLKFNNLTREQSDELEALLFELEGAAGRVRLWDFRARLVSAPPPVLGAPVVSAATSMGRVLSSRGWNPGVTVLRRGQWVQIGDELKRVLADVVADASGAAAIRIAPMLRKSWPSGTAIEVRRPRGVFRLDKDDWSGDTVPGHLSTYSLSFVEAFYP